MTHSMQKQSIVQARRWCSFVALLTLGAVVAGCSSDSPTEPPVVDPGPTLGALTVVIATTGEDPGEGYVLTLDGQPQDVVANQSYSWGDLVPGQHLVDLTELDYNCRITAMPQGPVLVTAGRTAEARFNVECRRKEIAFISGRDGNFEVYRASVSGSDQVRFLSLPQSKEDEPAWSPDGSRIAFATDRDGDFDIFAVDLLGNMENLTRNPAATEGMPTWSPDGTRIAYRAIVNGNADIWVMDANGDNQRPLIATPALEILPAWSPDGQSIAFVSDDDGDYEIWVYHLVTATYEQLTRNEDWDAWPSWSPDGRFLAFESGRDGNGEVYVMEMDGSNPTNVTNEPGSAEWLPSWSPDGRYLSFNTDRNGNLDIYWMRSDGTGAARQMTTSTDHDFFATWNPVPWPN